MTSHPRHVQLVCFRLKAELMFVLYYSLFYTFRPGEIFIQLLIVVSCVLNKWWVKCNSSPAGVFQWSEITHYAINDVVTTSSQLANELRRRANLDTVLHWQSSLCLLAILIKSILLTETSTRADMMEETALFSNEIHNRDCMIIMVRNNKLIMK